MPGSRFRKFVDSEDPAEPRLPLTHMTDAYRFDNALQKGGLEPKYCNVFKEPLLYLFYGRPSYRVRAGELPSGLDHYLPVCIIFRNDNTLAPKRIFPFDSGAFADRRYADAVHDDMDLHDFCLETNPSMPGKIISLFFGSVEEYCLANPTKAPKIPATQFEAKSYLALIQSQLRSNTDDRGSAVELQFDSTFQISKQAEAIIAPGPLLDDPEIFAFLTKNNIESLPYEQLGRQRPSDFVSDIFRLCREYFRRRGLLLPLP